MSLLCVHEAKTVFDREKVSCSFFILFNVYVIFLDYNKNFHSWADDHSCAMVVNDLTRRFLVLYQRLNVPHCALPFSVCVNLSLLSHKKDLGFDPPNECSGSFGVCLHVLHLSMWPQWLYLHQHRNFYHTIVVIMQPTIVCFWAVGGNKSASSKPMWTH